MWWGAAIAARRLFGSHELRFNAPRQDAQATVISQQGSDLFVMVYFPQRGFESIHDGYCSQGILLAWVLFSRFDNDGGNGSSNHHLRLSELKRPLQVCCSIGRRRRYIDKWMGTYQRWIELEFSSSRVPTYLSSGTTSSFEGFIKTELYSLWLWFVVEVDQLKSGLPMSVNTGQIICIST